MSVKIDDLIALTNRLLEVVPWSEFDLRRKLEWFQTDCYYKAPEQTADQLIKLHEILSDNVSFESDDMWQLKTVELFNNVTDKKEKEETVQA